MRSLNWSKTIKRVVVSLALALALTGTWVSVPANPPANPSANPPGLNKPMPNPVVPLVNWNS